MNPPERIKLLLRRHWLNLVLIGFVAYVWFRPPAHVTDENQPLPDLAFTTTDGRQGTLSSLRGKVVLINFWATWCPYCRKEMPAMQRFYDDYQKRGVEILALSVDTDPSKVAPYLHDAHYTFPTALAGEDWQRALGPVSQIPMSMIIDRDGHLRHRVKGQVYYGRLEDLIEPLLAQQPKS